MTRREVIASLLSRELPDRIGLNESFWPHIMDNGWAEQLPADTSFVKHFDLDLQCCDWHGVPGPRPDIEEVVSEDDESITRRTSWGNIVKQWKHKAGTPEHVGFAVEAPQIWYDDYRDAFLAMDPCQDVDFDAIKQRIADARDDDRFATLSFMFVFEWQRQVLGDVCMLESLLLEKDFIHDFNRAFTDHFLKFYQGLFDAGAIPDGIHFYEDLGYTQAAFASPDCHREMILPYHKELLGFFKDHDLPVIMHTCGDFRPHLPAIVEAGVDCIQALEAKTGMNVIDLAKDWKQDLCFMGNLDIRPMESGDRAAIDAEVLPKLQGMRDLRAPYICMSDHSIPPTVAVQDYEYVLGLYKANSLY